MPENLSPAQWVEVLHTDQRRRWQRGERVLVEAYLQEHPHLEAEAECLLQLVNNEVVLREAWNETPRLEEPGGAAVAGRVGL